MERYLVTGGAGFIGSHIVRALLEQGASVRVLDNFSSGRLENLQTSDSSLEVIKGDLRDSALVAQALRGIDVAFHEAAFVSATESMEQPQGCFDINVNGTLLLFEAARQARVRRMVIASSAAVYGDSDALPLQEDVSLHPLSPYGVSKQIDELLAALYTKSFGLEVVALRYFNVYGPRQRPDSMYAAAIPIFIRRLMEGNAVTIFGDGGQTRDLIFVDDVVRANLLAAKHSGAPGQVFNVCTGHETRILDLVETLSDLFPGSPRPEFDSPRAADIYKSVGSSAKASSILGFDAQTSLADGLRKTAEWMR